MPDAFKELVAICAKLEAHFRDMQDLEFTIQSGKLYMLQCRNAKRTGRAAVRVAVEMVKEGLISKDEAVLRVDAGALDQLLHPTIDPKAPKKLLARGLGASPGAASGHIVFSADEAERRAGQGQARHPRPHRDFARGHPRHEGGARHPDRARRDDEPRRGRRARDGQAVRRRLERAIAVNYEAQTMAITVYDDHGHAEGDRDPQERATSSRSTAAAARSSRARCRR